jgi:hypothetical protein
MFLDTFASFGLREKTARHFFTQVSGPRGRIPKHFFTIGFFTGSWPNIFSPSIFPMASGPRTIGFFTGAQ